MKTGTILRAFSNGIVSIRRGRREIMRCHPTGCNVNEIALPDDKILEVRLHRHSFDRVHLIERIEVSLLARVPYSGNSHCRVETFDFSIPKSHTWDYIEIRC